MSACADGADEDCGGGPVVVGANWYRFRSSEHVLNPHVMSISYVWVIHGAGAIRGNGQLFRLETNSVLRLPWHHRVEYFADERHPFQVGTVHVVPHHCRSAPVVPRVGYLPKDPLLDDPSRSGDPKAFRPSVSSSTTGAARRIAELGVFTIERFIAEPYDEAVFRLLAELILTENQSWQDARSLPAKLPVALEEMMAYVQENIGKRLAIDEIVSAGHCSPTTAQRLFNRHLGMSIQAWTRQTRMREAASLLRTSGQRISEISEMVGFVDPLHFSRAFRAEYGVPPSRYASGEIRP